MPQPSLTFPCLDLKKMGKEEKQHLQQNLYAESVGMIDKFQNLFSDTTKSLKEQNVSVEEILCHLVCLGPLPPTYDDLNLPNLTQNECSNIITSISLIIIKFCTHIEHTCTYNYAHTYNNGRTYACTYIHVDT